MEDKSTVRFRLVSIDNETINQKFNEIISEKINEHTIKFQFKIKTIIKLSEDTIIVIPSLRYLFDNQMIFEASADFNFSIDTLGEAIEVDKDNKKINVKANIFPSIIGAAYSTLRGIAFVRSQNTPLSKYPAPLIEIDTLLSKNGISVID